MFFFAFPNESNFECNSKSQLYIQAAKETLRKLSLLGEAPREKISREKFFWEASA